MQPSLANKEKKIFWSYFSYEVDEQKKNKNLKDATNASS